MESNPYSAELRLCRFRLLHCYGHKLRSRQRRGLWRLSFMAELAVSVSGWALALPLGHSPVRTEGASFADSLWIIARLASCAESLRFAFGLPSGLRLWESFVGFACGQPPSCVIPVSTGYTRGWLPAFAGCRPFGGASDSIPTHCLLNR